MAEEEEYKQNPSDFFVSKLQRPKSASKDNERNKKIPPDPYYPTRFIRNILPKNGSLFTTNSTSN
jgi:hypothetical protein